MILMIILFYHQEDSKMLEVYIMLQKNGQLIPYTLTDTDNSTLVRVHNGCSSGRNIWETMAFIFEAMLLITAIILQIDTLLREKVSLKEIVINLESLLSKQASESLVSKANICEKVSLNDIKEYEYKVS
jgi:hypothetical protein